MAVDVSRQINNKRMYAEQQESTIIWENIDWNISEFIVIVIMNIITMMISIIINTTISPSFPS